MSSKKRVLFLAPSFMNYENVIKDALAEKYDVEYIDTEIILKKVRVRYNKLPLFARGFLKTFKGIREKLRDRYLEYEIKNNIDFQKKINNCLIEQFDYIIVINGDGLPTSFFSKLYKTRNMANMVLYLWDDYDLLFKTKHIRFFDCVFSFNELDCRKYGYNKLSMFTPPNKMLDGVSDEKLYDICFIGSATPERVAFVKKLKKLYEVKYKIYVFLYSKENKYDIQTFDVPLNFDEYMEAISKSRCLFEIVRAHQKGPTTRVNDCKFVKTKVITTNNCEENYTGNGNNILVIDDKMIIPEEFVNAPYDENIEQGVTVERWLSIILKGL